MDVNRALQVAEKEVQEHAAPSVAGQQAALPMSQMGKLSLPPIVWNRLKFVLSEVHFRFQFYFLNLAALFLIFDRKTFHYSVPFLQMLYGSYVSNVYDQQTIDSIGFLHYI